MSSILTTAAELHTALVAGRYPDGGPVRVLDVRWWLDRPDGRPAFRAGHIPGARYADLDTQLAEHGEPAQGRHPLPSPETLQAAVRDWGIDGGDTVVVYDDVANLASGRAWWVLRDAGIADVRVLDGALGAWTDAGFDLEEGDVPAVRGGTAVVSPGTLPILGIDDVLDFARTGLLLDARAGERFRGEVEPMDTAPGTSPARCPRRRRRTTTSRGGSGARTSCANGSRRSARNPARRSASTAARASAPRTRPSPSASRDTGRCSIPAHGASGRSIPIGPPRPVPELRR
jgi:thiosulfate/3-mercaptopyruvate sulfurtransferase